VFEVMEEDVGVVVVVVDWAREDDMRVDKRRIGCRIVLLDLELSSISFCLWNYVDGRQVGRLQACARDGRKGAETG